MVHLKFFHKHCISFGIFRENPVCQRRPMREVIIRDIVAAEEYKVSKFIAVNNIYGLRALRFEKTVGGMNLPDHPPQANE